MSQASFISHVFLRCVWDNFLFFSGLPPKESIPILAATILSIPVGILTKLTQSHTHSDQSRTLPLEFHPIPPASQKIASNPASSKSISLPLKEFWPILLVPEGILSYLTHSQSFSPISPNVLYNPNNSANFQRNFLNQCWHLLKEIQSILPVSKEFYVSIATPKVILTDPSCFWRTFDLSCMLFK